MAIKRSEQLFGDDGANGPRAPIDETAPSGMGTEFRAIKFGEGLTSASYNRITYALALNDDDLNDRLGVFEAGGLDTVYRLGEADIAGGGRVITVDGGAVEARAAPDTAVGDRAQALMRTNTEAATVDGLVGYDFVARTGGVGDSAPGAALYGFVDRRLLVLDTPFTSLAPEMTGTLSGARLSVTTANRRWSSNPPSTSKFTDLMVGIDLVEIVSAPYTGTYILHSVDRATSNDAAYVNLQQLDGVMLNAAPNTAATFRVYRPLFATAGKVRANALRTGVTIAGLPADQAGGAALTLMPGQVGPSPRLGQGVPYALSVPVRGTDGTTLEEVGISAVGTFHARNPGVVMGEYMPSSFQRAMAGFRYVNEHPNGPAAGFLAYNRNAGAHFNGVMVQERRSSGAPGRVDGSSVIVDVGGATPSYFEWERRAALGVLLEVDIGGTTSVYRITGYAIYSNQAGGRPIQFTVSDLGGSAVSLGSNVDCTVYLLEGAVLGRQQYTMPTPGGRPALTKVTASIAGPVDIEDAPATADEVHVALQLANQSNAQHALFIRCLDGYSEGEYQESRWSEEVFSVSRKGHVRATKYMFPYEVERGELVPSSMFVPTRASTTAWVRDATTGKWSLPESGWAGHDAIIAPITGWLPRGARPSYVHILYSSDNGSAGFTRCRVIETRPYDNVYRSPLKTEVFGNSGGVGGTLVETIYLMDITAPDPVDGFLELVFETMALRTTEATFVLHSVGVTYTLDGLE